jgi:hypothetical protein
MVVVISTFSLLSCNQPATTSKSSDKDTMTLATKTNTSSMPAYDPAMEPLTVGAKYSKKLSDTLGVKMYEFTMKPGDSAALHTHPDHAVYVLQGGKLAVTFQGMGRQIMDLKTGMGFVSGGLSDAGKNVGNTTVKLLVVDMYRPRGE